MILLLPLLVSGLPMCEDVIYIGQNCTMLTPSLNCSTYNYDILNATSHLVIIDDAALTQLNETIYYFNFTLTTEETSYLVRLCDGSTREVPIEAEGKDEMIIGIAIVMSVMLAFLIVSSMKLNDSHWPLKVGFFYTAIGFGWGFINLAMRWAEDGSASTGITTTLDGIYIGYTAIALLAFAYLFIRIIWWFMYMLINRKKEEEEGLDDGSGGAW